MGLRYDTRRGSKAFGINLTPMVDVIFMLTIFFMLVTRFSSAEQIPLQLPKPDQSQAALAKIPQRVVINCRPAEGDDSGTDGVLYSIGPNQPEPLSAIKERLAAMKIRSPELQVVLRADRRLRYTEVREVMRVIAANGIERFNVVAHVSEDD